MEIEIIPRKVSINTTEKSPLGRRLNLLLLHNCKSLPPCLCSWIGINKVHSSEEWDNFTFLEVWWGIKRSQVAINCVSDLLYYVSGQHLLFFFKCTVGKNLLRCFIQARSLFRCIIKALVGARMNGLHMDVRMGMFNIERWVSMFWLLLMTLSE